MLARLPAAGQTVATFAPSGSGIEIGWWALFAGRPAPRGGGLHRRAWHARRADFRYLLEQLGANPAGWRCAFASPNAWNDRVPGMVMHKLLLIPLVPLSPIKPEGENPQ